MLLMFLNVNITFFKLFSMHKLWFKNWDFHIRTLKILKLYVKILAHASL